MRPPSALAREATLTGEELARAVLCMPVDLFWSGGIGTYVKASWQSNRVVGDRANSAVRVNANEMRASVVAEGGNLGFTQAARVEFALGGGAINTDAVDNSAGVDLSDHEVNFKVLLRNTSGAAPTVDERRPWLRACLDSVRQAVLAHSAAQSRAVSMDLARSREDPERLLRVAAFLARKADLDWRLEGLPDRDRLRSRTGTGGEAKGYVRPELCVLLGYTKMLVKRTLTSSSLPDHPALAPLLEGYFPEPLRGRFADEVAAHPLRREIVTTALCNRVIDAAGVTLVPELTQETGASIPEILAAWYASEELLEVVRLRTAIEAEPVPETERVRARLWLEQAVRDGARTRLGLERRDALAPEELAQWSQLTRSLRALLPSCLGSTELAQVEEARRELADRGLSRKLAYELASLPTLVRWFGAISLAASTGTPLPRVARLHARVGEETRIAWLLDRLAGADRRDGWDRLACDALAVDMLEAQRLVTERVLQSRVPEDAPRIFEAAAGTQLARIADTVAQLDTESRAGLAPLLLVSRQIRRLC
jgi:glutamate dehydrogenase